MDVFSIQPFKKSRNQPFTSFKGRLGHVLPEALPGFTGSFQGFLTRLGDLKMPLALAAPFAGGLAEARTQVAFVLQPYQGGMHGSQAHLAPQALRNLLPNGHTIGSVVKNGYRQQDDFFEFSQVISFHVGLIIFYNVGKTCRRRQVINFVFVGKSGMSQFRPSSPLWQADAGASQWLNGRMVDSCAGFALSGVKTRSQSNLCTIWTRLFPQCSLLFRHNCLSLPFFESS